MGVSMVPFHIAEIVTAIFVDLLVWKVINETGQKNIFIYLVYAMMFFVIGSIVGYSPHLGWMQDHNAALGEVILNTFALALMGLSFYKWRKMLG
jgi:uncharacterized membrane protein